MALPATTRARLRELLDIKQSSHTAVETTGGGVSVITSDGVTEADLAVITKEKLMAFLGVEEGEFVDLWKKTVMKADMTLSDVKTPLVEITEEHVEKNTKK
jgi:hypothetical protein